MAYSGRQAFFRMVRITKSLSGAKRMVHYIAFRSRELEHEQKGGFDRDLDQADVDRFCNGLDHRLTRHKSVAVAFHGVFSLPKEEADKAGLTDWRPFIRQVMGTYEAEKKVRLDWFAAAHDSETHPHCHIVIKAVYTNEDGRENRLRFNQDDLKQLRQIAGRTLSHQRWLHQAPERAARAAEFARSRQMADRLAAFQSGLDWLRTQIEKHRREMEREQEEAHQRWLRDD